MDSSFAGKPIFVEHVDEVASSLDQVKKEADGWVVESFYNSADGKHWVKFVIVSERGLHAVESGMRLSNAYLPTQYKSGGLWNGVQYDKEVSAAEYEHLAIVRNPRYEESVILTPEQFKTYNSERELELMKIANSKDEPKGEKKMAFKFFKRAKVENSVDIETTVVELPQSKKELTIAECILGMDKVLNMAGYADDSHMVKLDNGKEMSVKDMKDCMNKMEMDAVKKDAITEEGGEPGKGADDEAMNSEASEAEDMKDVGSRGGDESLDNAEEDMEEVKKKEMKKNEIKAKVQSLRNAGPKYEPEAPKVLLNSDKVALGKIKYGSN